MSEYTTPWAGPDWALGMSRQNLARDLLRAQKRERKDSSYAPDTSLPQYLQMAHGLETFLNYVRTGGLPSRILDIGTGKGRALSELAQSPLGESLSFTGTGLVIHPGMDDLPSVAFQNAMAEKLGIREDSIGGILSLRAMAFSKHPDLVVQNLDQALAEGGILKATFRKKGSYGKEWDKKYNKWGYQGHDLFSDELDKRGYDLTVRPTDTGDDVLVAVKPGKPDTMTADKLFELDDRTLPDQLARIR